MMMVRQTTEWLKLANAGVGFAIAVMLLYGIYDVVPKSMVIIHHGYREISDRTDQRWARIEKSIDGLLDRLERQQYQRYPLRDPTEGPDRNSDPPREGDSCSLEEYFNLIAGN